MTKNKQIRYATDPAGVARVGSVHVQQVQELAALTGESQNEVVRRAIERLYFAEVLREQEREIEQLREALLKAENALREYANQ